MHGLLQDIRLVFRQFLKAPGFTLVAIFSLALGIGANTAIFSLVNRVLLRPLPVERPNEIVAVNRVNLKDRDAFMSFSYPNYVDFRDRNTVLAGTIAHRFSPISLSRNRNNQRIWGYLVSGNYFDVLGVRPWKGRFFTQAEDRVPGANPVAVVSYGAWQHLFGSDPDLVGKTVTLNGNTYTIVGIAPQGFNGTELVYTPEIWVPMMMAHQIEPGSTWLERRSSGVMFVQARLKPGITRPQAEASLNGLAAQLAAEYPETNASTGISLTPPGLVLPQLRNPVLGFSGVLMGVVGIVLLIACTNLANLLLSRAVSRRKEIAVRLAIGAGRGRLIRQLLTESITLSIAGGAVGMFLAWWIINLAMTFRPAMDFPLTIDVGLDWRVLLFCLGLSLVTGILFGLVPALQATKAGLITSLRDDTSASGFRRSRLRNGLVIAQLAMSLILLVAAGLVIRSLQHVQLMGPGFQAEHAIALTTDLGLQGYSEDRARGFQKQLLDRVNVLPGVESASLISSLPLSLNRNSNSIQIEGQEEKRGAQRPEAMTGEIGPSYFETMGIPLVAGRDFTERDNKDAPRVAIINETFARRFWPGANPVRDAVGKRFSFSGASGPWVQVVGVSRDGKYWSLGEDPQPFAYSPLAQDFDSMTTLVVRTNREPTSTIAAVRGVVQQLDPNLPVFDVHTLTEHMNISLFPMRVGAAIVSGFGALALLLAAIGIYGVMAYSVTQRTREVGIRMSLGARPGDVLRLVMGQGLRLAFIGLAIGIVGAWLLTRYMSSVLYGVSARDPLTFIGIPFLLSLVVVLACFFPARRAARVDPMVALRHE
jgi:macrolide transport system ATP-binding/permease protein